MRIMLVDDEPVMPMALRYLLESVGIDSEFFDTSLSALEAFRAKPGRYDAMVTDLAMPLMRGTDLGRALQATRPGFPVVVLSGLLDLEAIDSRDRDRKFRILAKPAGLEEILRALGALGLDVPLHMLAAHGSAPRVGW